MPCFREFEIDIVSALRLQLVDAFEKLDLGPLSKELVESLPDGQGVYLLHHGSYLVYVGKSENLKKRLTGHRRKISGRHGIGVGDIYFKCLFLHKNWATLAPEASLIKYYSSSESSAEWNGNGFGTHDPGRNRETTDQQPQGFDARYPIRDDWPCDWVQAGDWNCHELLLSLKEKLPFLLRFEKVGKSPKGSHPDYKDLSISVPENGMPARNLLRLILRHLPEWQATVFPGHMILYKESNSYIHGEVLKPL